MITTFLYKALPVIDSIDMVGDKVEIAFRADTDGNVHVESTLALTDPFDVEEEAVIRRLNNGQMVAGIPVTAPGRFYRISVN